MTEPAASLLVPWLRTSRRPAFLTCFRTVVLVAAATHCFIAWSTHEDQLATQIAVFESPFRVAFDTFDIPLSDATAFVYCLGGVLALAAAIPRISRIASLLLLLLTAHLAARTRVGADTADFALVFFSFALVLTTIAPTEHTPTGPDRAADVRNATGATAFCLCAAVIYVDGSVWTLPPGSSMAARLARLALPMSLAAYSLPGTWPTAVALALQAFGHYTLVWAGQSWMVHVCFCATALLFADRYERRTCSDARAPYITGFAATGAAYALLLAILSLSRLAAGDAYQASVRSLGLLGLLPTGSQTGPVPRTQIVVREAHSGPVSFDQTVSRLLGRELLSTVRASQSGDRKVSEALARALRERVCGRDAPGSGVILLTADGREVFHMQYMCP